MPGGSSLGALRMGIYADQLHARLSGRPASSGLLCFALAPVALAILFFYSFSKRFTLFSHLILGFSLGIAPAAAWIAMRGTLDPRILWLTAAVMFWTAGFDVIYACQDFEFDCAEGLFSLPRRFGLTGALRFARLFMSRWWPACLPWWFLSAWAP